MTDVGTAFRAANTIECVEGDLLFTNNGNKTQKLNPTLLYTHESCFTPPVLAYAKALSSLGN